ncbi:FadR/GntR family transcriptional regulator [Spelaeicoccus albus]|uniref:DNA-binding FadR family transcriptional regulator n=1 Tax=Spelaeicoccus albus TaxID=1280376 RepID=A0A7Z0D2X4_9MICO|nr:FCD domain-containing protein [Spelaeicoccus albus]NYI67888.1 DNA-binding FadR family transcriptional regulator [Spelaeicoccus albus]
MSALHAPRRSETLSAQVAGQLRELIAAGEWAVGRKIPTEQALTESLHVSRNTVREAIRSLVHSGLLQARPGDGTYVLATSELEVAIRRRLDTAKSDDVFEVRMLLEQRAARLAAQNATPDDLAAIRACLTDRDAALAARDDAAFFAADAAFHRAVVRAGHNELLAELHGHLAQVADSLDIALLAPSGLQHYLDDIDGVNSRHDALFAAIEDRNAALAESVTGAIVHSAHVSHAVPPSGSHCAAEGHRS